jgi:hypothetical protein
VFGRVTGRDPRSLGETECSGYELGLSAAQVAALQKVAADELASDGVVLSAPHAAIKTDKPERCTPYLPQANGAKLRSGCGAASPRRA